MTKIMMRRISNIKHRDKFDIIHVSAFLTKITTKSLRKIKLINKRLTEHYNKKHHI